MAVYNFSLMSGYEIGGVDSAQGFRCKALKKAGYDPKFVFVDFPTQREYGIYRRFGIDYDQMCLVQASFSDCGSLTPTISGEEMVSRVYKAMDCDEIIRRENYVILARKYMQVAGVILDGSPEQKVLAVQYMNQLCIIRVDYYTDYLFCTDYYAPIPVNGGVHAVMTRRSYRNRDGSTALEELVQSGAESSYRFPDGFSCNRRELIGMFIDQLKLTEKDTVIVDRPQSYLPQERLLAGKAKVATVFHSEHMYQKGCSTMGVGLNREYYYWFRNSDRIHTMIVSTENQKQILGEDLRSRGRSVPDIRVIPAAGVPRLKYPGGTRHPGSVICASRLEERKKITWAVYAVIRAHEKDPRITLDIYGDGSPDYLARLRAIIAQNHAESYIRLMGFADLTEVYQNYELMLTTSVWETLGITSMEAAAAGCAIVGFDVRYGNPVFIRNGENGYLVDYCPAHGAEECPPETQALADRIVDVFSDAARLERFHEKSYEIAEGFLTEKLEKAWVKLVEENGHEDSYYQH